MLGVKRGRLRACFAVAAATLPFALSAWAGAADPWVVHLWYADGGPPPSQADCSVLPDGQCATCAGRSNPPPYRCAFGKDIEDCKRKVQAHLDRWYQPFNVIFTFVRPTSGRFSTVLITTDNTWCDPALYKSGRPQPLTGVGGLASIDCTGPLTDHTCYAFKCADSDLRCAATIAQEQAHLVGLQHTRSPTDLLHSSMAPWTPQGFENKTNMLSVPFCGKTAQNSFEMMMAALGAWPGGPKPDPFGPPANTDSGAPFDTDAGAPEANPRSAGDGGDGAGGTGGEGAGAGGGAGGAGGTAGGSGGGDAGGAAGKDGSASGPLDAALTADAPSAPGSVAVGGCSFAAGSALSFHPLLLFWLALAHSRTLTRRRCPGIAK